MEENAQNPSIGRRWSGARPTQHAAGGAQSRVSTASDPVVVGASIGRSRHSTHAGAAVVELRRCLTCKIELAAGVHEYCDAVCQLKNGRTHRSPGRTAARRRRRRRHR